MKNKETNENALAPKRSALNLLKNLTKSSTSYSQNQKSLEESKGISYNQTAFALTNKLFYSTREGEHNLRDLESQDDEDEKLLLEAVLFRRNFGSLSSINNPNLSSSGCSLFINKDYFLQISQGMEFYNNSIGKGKNTEDLLVYYQFLSLFRLTFLALKISIKLNFSIDTILMEEEENERFFKNLQLAMNKSIEIFENLPNPGSEGFNEEIYVIWQDCNKTAQEVQFILLNLNSKTTGGKLGDKIDELINAFETENITSSHTVFLKYLSLPSTLESIFTEESEDSLLSKIKKLFKILVCSKTVKIQKYLDSIVWDGVNEKFTYEEVEEISESFMHETAKSILIFVFAKYKGLHEAIIEQNKKRKEDIMNIIEARMAHYDDILNILAQACADIFETNLGVTKRIFSNISNELISEKYYLKENEEKNDKVYEKYLKFEKDISEVILKNNKFLNLYSIYVLSLGSEEKTNINPHNLNIIEKSLIICKKYTEAADIYKESELFYRKGNVLIRDLDNTIISNLVGVISRYAGGLLSLGKERPSNLLKGQLSSKLFSGGLMNSQIKKFSKNNKETIKTLQEYIKIDLDIEADPEEIDPSILALLHSNADPQVDSFVRLLDWNE